MALSYINNKEIKFGSSKPLNGVYTPGSPTREYEPLDSLGIYLNSGIPLSYGVENNRYMSMSDEFAATSQGNSYSFNQLFAAQMMLGFKLHDRFIACDTGHKIIGTEPLLHKAYLAEITEKTLDYFKIKIYEEKTRTFCIRMSSSEVPTSYVDLTNSFDENGLNLTQTDRQSFLSYYRFYPLTARDFSSRAEETLGVDYYLLPSAEGLKELSGDILSKFNAFISSDGSTLTNLGNTAFAYAGDINYVLSYKGETPEAAVSAAKKAEVILGQVEEMHAGINQILPEMKENLELTKQYRDEAMSTEIGTVREDLNQLKGDLGDKLEKANDRVYIGDIVDNKWQQNNGNEYGNNFGFYLSANVQPNTKYYASGTRISNAFPLIVMFDENNSVIGTEGLGEDIADYDYEFVTPSNCVKVSVNGSKVPTYSYSVYPSLYYIQNKDLDGNDLESQITSKQNEISEWRKATYLYEVSKYVKEDHGKAIVISDSSASGYKYAKLIYDKNKKYRFFGECRTSVIPILLCCDENDNIIKIYDSIADTVAKGKEYNDIPENTYCIYVNGYLLIARVEIKEQRNTTSFESKKIGVCFGDSITQGNNVYISNYITPINDYPSVVGKTLDCIVYNGGLGGSTYSSGRSIDFKNVCDCVVSGDFSTVIDGISEYGLNASAVLQYNAISELDFNDVDFISIALGTNDWNFGASSESIKNAMRYCISTLLTAYPHLKIYVFTPIYRFNLGGSGQDSDTYVNTASGLKLHDVCDAIIETAKEFNVPCKDMYYGCNINQYNKELYMGDDTHPNANGYALMGEKIAKFINSN